MSTEGTPVVSAEDIAAYLRWLLGNHNFELDDTGLDAASDAFGSGTTIDLVVSASDPVTRASAGTYRFTLTVAPAGPPTAGGGA